jgi:hypothetical protein
MSSLLVLVVSFIVVSCSSFQNTHTSEAKSQGYQHGRQMDERSLKSGFLER